GLIAKAADAVARTAGYFIIMVNTDEDRVHEREIVEGLLARRVDGLLLVSADDDHSYLAHDIGAGTGIVFLDRPPRGLQADSVTIDNRGGARDAVANLIGRGHHRISFIGDHDYLFTARERRAGYEQAMHRAQLGGNIDVLMGIHDVASAEAATTWVLERTDPPTAIFAGNNLIAIGVVRATRRADADIDIIGFDDLPDRPELPIGLVGYDVSALATHGMGMLLERLNRPGGPARHVSIPTRIVAPRARARSLR
ncbi:MAG: substrate-binding domain-containing protein, partial [Acidimicrobiia bacterium]